MGMKGREWRNYGVERKRNGGSMKIKVRGMELARMEMQGSAVE